jgi:hypothetical protein
MQSATDLISDPELDEQEVAVVTGLTMVARARPAPSMVAVVETTTTRRSRLPNAPPGATRLGAVCRGAYPERAL